MKVIILGPAHPLRGGLASYNERLARAFIASGHDCRIVTYSLQYPGFLFPGKTQFSDQPPPKDFPVEVSVNSVNPMNWIAVGNRIATEKPDLLVFRYWMPFMAPAQGTIARRVRKNRHTRIVAITDNIIPHEKMMFGDALTGYFLRSCDGFITMSESVLKDIETLGINKPSKFVPHPLYDNFGEAVPRENALRELGLDSSFRYLLFFGFIRKYKGLDLLLEAFADSRLRKFPVKLIIAGEYYEDPSPYKTMIRNYGLKEFIIERNDFIPDDRVKHYFSAADLITQTYRHATQSGVTQVALQFRKPVLVTRVGGLAEMVPHGQVGFVTDPSARAISEKLLEFLAGNPERFQKGIEEERKRFSWSLMVDEIINITK
ncbi:MAG: glycosyltransferase [Bacteroidia bacterium]|nr:glycosyltransferase [Bacteroidia bacterium]